MTVTRQNQTAENNLNGKNGKTNRMQISAVKTHKMDLEGEKQRATLPVRSQTHVEDKHQPASFRKWRKWRNNSGTLSKTEKINAGTSE